MKIAHVCLFVLMAFISGVTARSNRTAADTGAAAQWGYGYEDLRFDLEKWRQSPFVQIDSIGASVQNRALWMLTITEGDTTSKSRIFMHARTHPAEVQAFWVAQASIDFLVGNSQEAKRLRQSHIIHVVPMYNPDGVELGKARQNANNVDLESNWNAAVPEPEVIALRTQFEILMAKPNPIRVALNLHSDQYLCTRFFFYHDSAGTSPYYNQLEKTFVNDVQQAFPGGIEPWSSQISWKDSTQTKYPEGWWWKHYQEKVMALTYEDTNCPNASDFMLTGQALILGSSQFMDRNGLSIRVVRPNARNSMPFPNIRFRVDGKIEGGQTNPLRSLIYFR
jgi:hypothetical protein